MSKGWVRGLAEWTEGNTAYLSVAFTWLLDDAYQRAVFWKSCGKRVCVGGPGLFVRKSYFEGVAEYGNDYVDAIVKHNRDATMASRGCPVGCWFCIVPKMEGKTFTLFPDFPVRPILCDNNLSALPSEYQDYIIRRYQDHHIPLLDANSGFEPRTFDGVVYHRWKAINHGPWRFALDDQRERKYVARVCTMLKDEPPNKKRVYVLIGNEPLESCLDRINSVLGWGCEPHVQWLMKLNALRKEPWVRFDWTERKLRDMARWANRRVWRYAKWEEYRGSMKSKEIYDSAQGLFL